MAVAAERPTRRDTYAITVTVMRHNDPTVPVIKGIWDKMTGGQLDSEETKYYPGDMADPVSLGGRKTVENVTLQRLYKLGRDHIAMQALFNGVGKSRVIISRLPKDIDGNASGVTPIVWNGTLKRVTPPDVDSESNEAGLLEIEVTVDGYPTV